MIGSALCSRWETFLALLGEQFPKHLDEARRSAAPLSTERCTAEYKLLLLFFFPDPFPSSRGETG